MTAPARLTVVVAPDLFKGSLPAHEAVAVEAGLRDAATGATLLVTAHPGCFMQVAASLDRLGTRVAMAHTVEVLDASLRGLSHEQIGITPPSEGA